MKELTLFFIVLIIIIFGGFKLDEYKDRQPCEYWANSPMKNVPLKCLK